MTKADIVLKMQNIVENFDFTCLYKDTELKGLPKQSLFHKTGEDMGGNISYVQQIWNFDHRHLNFCCAYYKPNDKVVNPKLILRFNCKAIN